MRHGWLGAGILATGIVAMVAHPAVADLALSSNDSHTVLVNGVQVLPASPPADTLTVIDLAAYPPTILHTIDVPGSVVGPPMAVAIARDESFAIVTSATKAGTKDGAGAIVPDDRVSVIDLTAKPPAVIQTLAAGAGASTVRIAPDGTLALVANRTAGTLSVFTIAGKTLTPAGTVMIDPKSMPSGIAFLPDGKRALLTRNGDHILQVLLIDGTKVTLDPRPLTTGIAPYTVDITADGALAAVGNMGRGDGDVDTVSLVDLTLTPMRTIQTISVGRSPEGVRWSPDGKFLAVGAQNGTTKAPDSPLYNDKGRLIMLALDNKSLRPVVEAPIGRWSQGIAFSRDGRTVLVQNMMERTIQVFRWDGAKLFPSNPLEIAGGPAAIMTAWP